MCCTRSLQWCTSASVCRPSPWYYIIDQGVNLQTTWDTNIWKGNLKKKWILDILLTYIQRKGRWQVFFRKGRKLKIFCQVHKEVLGTSNSLGKPLYILVTWWYLPGPQSQWQQPIVSSSLSASHLKKTPTKQNKQKTPPKQNKTKPKKQRRDRNFPSVDSTHKTTNWMLLIARYWFASVNKVQEDIVKKTIQQQSLKVKISVRYDIKQSGF